MIAPFNIRSPFIARGVADAGPVEKTRGHGYTAAMVTRGFFGLLALLRIAAGTSLLTSGLQKLAWFGSTAPLDQTLAKWAEHPANAMVAKYLSVVTAHHGLFARLVVLGELSLGTLLIVGFLTPLAALLAFVMVLQFQFASQQVFSLNYLRGQSALAYLLIYPALFFGRAGTVLGLDGMLSRRPPKSGV
jgi:uncharacterized membrane protein YphA (DoxX/SURF4 family)